MDYRGYSIFLAGTMGTMGTIVFMRDLLSQGIAKIRFYQECTSPNMVESLVWGPIEYLFQR